MFTTKSVVIGLMLGACYTGMQSGCGGKPPESPSPSPQTNAQPAAKDPGVRRKSLGRTYADETSQMQPMVYKDETSGTLYYFESDGKHVTAIDPKGTVLWHRNPVQELPKRGTSKGGQTGDRVIEGRIVYAGPPSDRTLQTLRIRGKVGPHLVVTFSTSEFGALDMKSGDFSYLGSDY